MSEVHESHLSGADLEALASGDAVETPAAQHLASCPQCQAALTAMRDENRLFAAELASLAPQKVSVTTAPVSKVLKVEKLPPQSHQPLVFYAVAASIMLVSALGLIYYGKQPDQAGSGAKPQVADRSKAPLEKIADDKDKPRDTNPAENEPTYEGSTAAQWVAQLKKELADNKPLSPLGTKAVHALVELGRDALPQVLELARTPGDAYASTAGSIVRKMDLQQADLQLIAVGLKDIDYATRLAAMNLLGEYALSHTDAIETAKLALEPMLHDRDKAVIEATRNELAALTEAPQLLGPGGPAAISLNDTTNAAQVYGPAGGRVLAIKNDIGLVMLSIGSAQGAKAGAVYAVRRNDKLISKVQIEKVYPDMSSAKVLQDAKNKAIQINDDVALEQSDAMGPGTAAAGEDAAEREFMGLTAYFTEIARGPATMWPGAEMLLRLDAFIRKYPEAPVAARARAMSDEIKTKMHAQAQQYETRMKTLEADARVLELQKKDAADPARAAEIEARLEAVKQELDALFKEKPPWEPAGNGSKLEPNPTQEKGQKEVDQLKLDIEKLREQMPKVPPDVKKPEPVKKEEF